MERLRTLRKNMQLYQKDVASHLGIDRTTYVKYETGASQPDGATLAKLADYFGVTVDYLLGREAPQKEKPTDNGELDEDMLKISELVSSLDESRLDAALEIAQKISALDDDEVKAILAVIRSMGKK